jgi:hypothetical protein
MPKSLDLDRLKRFEPVVPKSTATVPATETLQADRWPSREAPAEGQISIKGPLTTLRRFKSLCKSDRRTYADMLEILMNQYEAR